MLRRLLVLASVLATAACTQAAPATQDTGNPGKDLTIAFLMPCSTCADRFESKDKPYFEEAVKAIDPNIKVIAGNAQGDAAVQLQQAESALTNGAKVIVVSPFTAEAGASIVAKADAAGARVIAYDGAIEGAVPAAYVSFQNEKVGELQGQYLLDKLPPGATVAMINGDITSAPGREFKAGAHKILDPAFQSGRLKLGYESDTPGFDPAKGQQAMEQGLTKLADNVQGVVAPNDGLANAVITALTARKLNGKVLVTGQDATDAGLGSILAGNQSMTVYKSIRAEATATAQIAVALAKGDAAGVTGLTTSTVDNGTGKVPALLLDPVAVTKENIADVVIKDGYSTKDKICAGLAADKCSL
ncbi:sugar ABC transporter substrate-binding protein [Dactylosporangium sp. McL0621]|uniref:sugar ABC transporter substrate-binding protein n=1 Tax=Dactylosporangium sp. McL0621 TaxID=3415678 RepID=UPI003CF20BBA